MNDKLKECLLEVYHAEQTGEIIFEALLKNARNEEERFIFASMLQLETEAKAIMRPTLMRLGLSIEENPLSREQGIKIGQTFQEISFEDLILNIKNSVESIYLPQYEELATLITEEDKECIWLAKFMGDHERALLLASNNIIDKSKEHIKPVTDMLRFPIAYR